MKNAKKLILITIITLVLFSACNNDQSAEPTVTPTATDYSCGDSSCSVLPDIPMGPEDYKVYSESGESSVPKRPYSFKTSDFTYDGLTIKAEEDDLATFMSGKEAQYASAGGDASNVDLYSILNFPDDFPVVTRDEYTVSYLMWTVGDVEYSNYDFTHVWLASIALPADFEQNRAKYFNEWGVQCDALTFTVKNHLITSIMISDGF